MNDDALITGDYTANVSAEDISQMIAALSPESVTLRSDIIGGDLIVDHQSIIFNKDTLYASTSGQSIIWAVRQIDNDIHFFSDIPVYNNKTLRWEGTEILVPFADRKSLSCIDCDKPVKIHCQLFADPD